MQEPSPGTTTQNIPGVSSALFPNNSHQMIGSFSSDAADTVLTVPELSTSLLDPQAQAQLEADKRAVYKHPLFPLLALLFEKCEIATQCADASPSESFNLDIQAFVQHQELDGKPFFSDNSEVDGLMVKAIQVLRIHMLELEKVQELCKDFCKRYITCLKNKMQSENLLRTDYQGLGGSSESSSPNSVGSNDSCHQQPQQQNNGSVASFVRIQPRVNQNAVPMAAVSPGQIVSGGTVYQMVQTPQGIVAQPIQIQTSPISQPAVTTHVIHGSTPLSQIGISVPSTQEQRIQPIAPRSSLIPSDDDEELISKKKQKRGVLPKHATSVMRSWLFQHLVHPYPTEDEKRQLAAQTNLTLLQVNNWFINARRRILQPMLDASNNENAHKSKKPKVQSSRCLQRFWPENIASLQPQVPTSSQSQDSNASVDPGATGSGSSTSRHEDHCENESSPSCHVELSPNDSLSQSVSDASSSDEGGTLESSSIKNVK